MSTSVQFNPFKTIQQSRDIAENKKSETQSRVQSIYVAIIEALETDETLCTSLREKGDLNIDILFRHDQMKLLDGKKEFGPKRNIQNLKAYGFGNGKPDFSREEIDLLTNKLNSELNPQEIKHEYWSSNKHEYIVDCPIRINVEKINSTWSFTITRNGMDVNKGPAPSIRHQTCLTPLGVKFAEAENQYWKEMENPNFVADQLRNVFDDSSFKPWGEVNRLIQKQISSEYRILFNSDNAEPGAFVPDESMKKFQLITHSVKDARIVDIAALFNQLIPMCNEQSIAWKAAFSCVEERGSWKHSESYTVIKENVSYGKSATPRVVFSMFIPAKDQTVTIQEKKPEPKNQYTVTKL